MFFFVNLFKYLFIIYKIYFDYIVNKIMIEKNMIENNFIIFVLR